MEHRKNTETHNDYKTVTSSSAKTTSLNASNCVILFVRWQGFWPFQFQKNVEIDLW